MTMMMIIIIIRSHDLNARLRLTPASPSSASCFGPVLRGSVAADFHRTTPQLLYHAHNFIHQKMVDKLNMKKN